MKELSKLVESISDAKTQGDLHISITSITADSREIEKGSLFICLEGAHVDGHTFVDKAIAAGAKALLVSKPVDVPADIAVIMVPDTRIGMQELVPAFYEYPASKMRMIGVTGTNGKTTTSHIIGHVLREQGYKVGIIGTVHILINDVSYPIHNTTPDVADLQKILSQMVEEGVTHCVMEVSSHALELGRVAGIEFDNAIFTNLTQDHLDFHKTVENYLEAKCKLFELVSASNIQKLPKGATINIDDKYGQRVVEKTAVDTITYSTEGKGRMNAHDVHMTSKTSDFKLSFEGTTYDVHMRLSGLFNVYNTMAAIGACVTEGLSIPTILNALENFSTVPGRFELIEEGQPFAVVVDYAHTPDGLENILQTAQEIVEKDIIVVFGCGGDRDATKRPIMGAIAAKYADKIFVTSDNPRTEDPQTIVEQVAQGVIDNLRPGTEYLVEVDRRTAINKAIAVAGEGDVILIAGKGHEDYQILKDKTIHFDDREEARLALRGR